MREVRTIIVSDQSDARVSDVGQTIRVKGLPGLWRVDKKQMMQIGRVYEVSRDARPRKERRKEKSLK